jgi:hypothetical protein
MLRRKKMTLMKIMLLFMRLSLMIMKVILFHPHHLFCSNKFILLQLTVQGETLLLVSI